MLWPDPPPDGPWQVSAVALDVSGTCNLACAYCAESATQPERCGMEADTLEEAWRLLYPDGTPRPGTSIRLGSGEPLMALPLLRALDDKIRVAGGSAAEGRPAVFLTTNGTLASPPVRDWLVETGWFVKISLDGPEEIHDRWRVWPGGRGTYHRVKEAVDDLASRMPDRFSVTAVLCRDADPRAVFDAIAGLGVRRIELVPVAHDDPRVVPGIADVRRYGSFVADHARRLAADGDLPATLVRFENRVRRVMGFDVRPVPCAAGRGFLGVGPDGGLYPCFRFVGVPDFRLGDLNTGLDNAAAARFAADDGRGIDERARCAHCWAAPLCGGPCFASASMFGSRDGSPDPLHCEYVRADAVAAIWLVEELRRVDASRLLDFLPRVAQDLVEAL